jgi:hypothetical protein
VKNIKYRIVLIALFVAILSSCNNSLTIEPISKEMNDNFITGKRLNTNYFSTQDVMQYYQISHYSALSAAELQGKLHKFVQAKYRLKKNDTLNNLTILFYEKKLFGDYEDIVFESARDNENRTLIGYEDNLIARTEFTRLKNENGKAAYWQLLYIKDSKPLSKIDTIELH